MPRWYSEVPDELTPEVIAWHRLHNIHWEERFIAELAPDLVHLMIGPVQPVAAPPAAPASPTEQTPPTETEAESSGTEGAVPQPRPRRGTAHQTESPAPSPGDDAEVAPKGE